MIDKKTQIQYEIMTDKNENGNYIPNFTELISEASNEAMKAKWSEIEEAINNEVFPGFAFNCVYIVKRACGHYEVLQHPVGRDIEDYLEFMKNAENSRCTRCICHF